MRRTTKRKEQSGSPSKDSDSSKRMRQTNSPVSFDFSETDSVADFGRAALKQVREATDSRRRGILIATNFEALPSKADLPDYYTIITSPIALDTIEGKLDSYQSVQEIVDDFKLMETNANTYNKTNSLIAQFSTKIRILVDELASAFNASKNTDGATQAAGGESYTEIQDVLAGIVKRLLNEVRDSSGETYVGDFFRSLVSKKDYPDYYRMIKNPISLKEIERKLKSKTYLPSTIVSEFEDDIFLMLDNCALYNEPHSEVMDDARILEAWFIPVMAENRKRFGLAPRTLPPEGRQVRQVKSEDVVMENGIEPKPRIILKMNGSKQAASPPNPSTTASTPAALGAAQSPPPGSELSRNPFQASRSPHPAATSPANLGPEKPMSPALAAATPQPQTLTSTAAIPVTKPVITAPTYADFRLNPQSIRNGLIIHPLEPTNHSILRRPGSTDKDSPIQCVKLTVEPDSNEPWVINIRPESDRWRCGSYINLNQGQSKVRFEIYPHPKLLSNPYGVWVQHQGHHPNPLPTLAGSGRFSAHEFRITPGKDNYFDIIADMVTIDDEGKQSVEKAIFWFNLLGHSR
ncbi:hypothetical protein TWF281_000458 [Arthrobotrys megalospora]